MPETVDFTSEWTKQVERNAKAVQITKEADKSLEHCIEVLKRYNQHRKTSNCPVELDFGLLCELMIAQEQTVRLD